MPRVTLKHPPCMSSEEVENAPRIGTSRFWVARKGADYPSSSQHLFDMAMEEPEFEFLPIGNHRADAPLFLQIDMPYGKYVLGCGYGRNKLRRPFEVTLLGVKF